MFRSRPITARYVRFNPKGWIPLGHICMRVEIYLCHTYQGCPKPDQISSTTAMPSSEHSFSHTEKITTVKTNEPTKDDSKLKDPKTDSVEWEAYSSGLRTTDMRSTFIWISLLFGLLSLWQRPLQCALYMTIWTTVGNHANRKTNEMKDVHKKLTSTRIQSNLEINAFSGSFSFCPLQA